MIVLPRSQIRRACGRWTKNFHFIIPMCTKRIGIYDIIHFLRREMLDFTAFPVFFVSNLLLVQRKKYYFNRAMVSRNCSIVL